MKPSISVIVLTYNEELHLARCLESVKNIAGEVLVVDSGSTDGTVKIAERYGAKISFHPFKNQAEQFNWALDNLEIKSDWILRLDADEWLTDELQREIAETIGRVPEEVSGFYMKRRVYFMGRWIRHGGYYPAWILRLFRKDKARSEEREVDEHIVIFEGITEKFKNDFVDENLHEMEWWMEKQNKHSSREVAELLKTGKGTKIEEKISGAQPERKRWLKMNLYYRLPMFCRAFLFFFYRYVLRGGFLDGREGLIFHFLSALWYRFLVDAKLYEHRKSHYR